MGGGASRPPKAKVGSSKNLSQENGGEAKSFKNGSMKSLRSSGRGKAYKSSDSSEYSDSFKDTIQTIASVDGMDEKESRKVMKKILKRHSISTQVVADGFVHNRDQADLFSQFLHSTTKNEIGVFVEDLMHRSGEVSNFEFIKQSFVELKRLLQINTLARELSLRHDSKSQFAYMIRTICDLVNADRAVLYLCDHHDQVLRVQVVRQSGLGPSNDKFSMTFPVHQGLCGWVMNNGVSVNVENAYLDERFSPVLDETTDYKTKGLLTVPVGFAPRDAQIRRNSVSRIFSSSFMSLLQSQTTRELGKLVEGAEEEEAIGLESGKAGSSFRTLEEGGAPFPFPGLRRRTSQSSSSAISEPGSKMEVEAVIQVMNKQTGEPFNQDDVSLLESVGTIIAGFISHSKLQEKERIERLRKETILDIAVALGSSRDVHSLIHTVVGKLQRTFNVDRCSLFFVNKEKHVLWTIVSGYSQELKNVSDESIVELPLDKGIAGYVAKTGEMLNIRDAYTDPRFNKEVDRKTNYRTRSILCGPIKDSSGQVVAVVQIINKKSTVLMNFSSFRNARVGTSKPESKADSFRESSKESIAYGGGENLEAAFDQDDEALLSGMFSMLGVAIANMDLFSQSFIIQNRLKCILENVTELVLTVDKNGRLMGSNRTSREINSLFGSAISSEAMRSQMVADWVPDREIANDLRSVLQAASNTPSCDLNSLGVTRSEYQLEPGNVVNYTIKPLTGAGTSLNNLIRLQQNSTSVTTTQGTNNSKIRGPSLQESYSVGSNISSRAQSAFEMPTRAGSMVTKNLERAGTYGLEMPFGSRESLSDFLVPNNGDENGDNDREFLGAVICIDDKTPEQKLKKTLNKYLAPDIVDHLLTQDGKLQLGGVKQKVSILFSDIRGFTTFSEEAGAQEVFQTLNEYFSCMVEVITRHGGIVDKFIGDALMAVFGVPKQTDHDSKNACLAALDMEKELEVFNKKRREQGKTEIKIGIGVSTGEVYCGNIGSENRFEYTVIGDSVNVASRLETSTKEYGITNLISDSTFQDIAEKGALEVAVTNAMRIADLSGTSSTPKLFVREVDLVRVAGKDGVTRLYEVIGMGNSLAELLPENKLKAMQFFSLGLTAYRRKEISKAFSYFEQAADEGDVPSILFEERCDHLLENGGWEHPDWDGVWDMQKVSVWTYKKMHERPPKTRRASSCGRIENLDEVIASFSHPETSLLKRPKSEIKILTSPIESKESHPELKLNPLTEHPHRGMKERDRKRSIILSPDQNLQQRQRPSAILQTVNDEDDQNV